MKIDVEGWESYVLQGGAKSLGGPDAPLLQVEFTEDAAKAAGCSCQALYRMLSELGFEMFTFDASSNALAPDPMRDRYPYVNLLATKNPESINARLGELRATQRRRPVR